MSDAWISIWAVWTFALMLFAYWLGYKRGREDTENEDN